MSFTDELDAYLRARYALLVLCSREEERILEVLKDLCRSSKRTCFTWDIAEGFRILAGDAPPPNSAKDAMQVLNAIDEYDGEALFTLIDFHDCWEDFRIKRKLRSLVHRLKYTRKSIIVTSPGRKLPPELHDEAVLLELPPPDEAQLERVLARLLRTPGVRMQLDEDGKSRLIGAAKGLTAAQAQRIFALAIVKDGTLGEDDVRLVGQQKAQIIRDNPALEFYPADQGLSDVGGLTALKRWVQQRARAFTPEAVRYGLPAPKGVALIGIPGTGKSLSAKMIAGIWKQPLIRLDVGALFGSFMGESEERARHALRLAETIAPCVIWIDELEKALSQGGGGGGQGDGGTSTRVLGTILTWMQEKQAPCFVVATANNIANVPPELLRRGRFDEIFFLDLPNEEERRAIITLHLLKRERDPRRFDITRLVEVSAGYVGAEIEQAIIDALYHAFDGRRDMTTEDLVAACHRLIPMSVSQRENIAALRRWLAEGRAQSASHDDNDEAQRQTVHVPGGATT